MNFLEIEKLVLIWQQATEKVLDLRLSTIFFFRGVEIIFVRLS